MKQNTLLAALTLTFSALLFQCKKDEGPYVVPAFEEPEKDPPPSLVGKWEEEYSAAKLFGGNKLTVEFRADSTFHMDIEMWSDTPTGEPCPNNRTDHIKGKYWSKDGYLRFTGKYCDSTFSHEKANCEGFLSYSRFSTCQLSAQYLTLDPVGNDPFPLPRNLKRQ